MSTPREKQAEGISLTTLAIASAASVAAAIFTHKLWSGGAIVGAAITPLIVALVTEGLKRPTDRITTIRAERAGRSRAARRTPSSAPIPPPPELERPDPYGIWEADRSSLGGRLRGRPLKIALATGLLAFLIAGFALTGAELVLGGPAGGGDDGVTFVPGTQKKKAERDEPVQTTTQPGQEMQTTPGTTQPPPATEPPATTTPTTPTTPAPTATTPAPEPTPQPAPQTPAQPGG